MKIGGVSAQIVTALGKLGGEFNYNINITRANGNTRGSESETERKDNSYANRRLPTPEEE